MRLRVLSVLALIATLVSAVAASPAQAADTLRCDVSMNSDGQVVITLPEQSTFSPRGWIVERKRDGSQWWWRTRGANVQFVDTVKAGSIYEYRIKSTGDTPETGFCGVVDLAGGPEPQVMSCDLSGSSWNPNDMNVYIAGNLDFTHIQKKWVLYRSVNGSPLHWRGVVGAWFRGHANFNDTIKVGQSVDYFIVSVGADGSRSEPFPCGNLTHQYSDPVVPAYCGQDAGIPIPSQRPALVTERTAWTSGVAIYRSIDGGPAYWRAKTTATNLFDGNWYWVDETLEPGDTRKFEYWVELVGYQGRRSERIYCGEMEFREQ